MAAQEQAEGGHCGVLGTVGDSDGIWQGVEVERRARWLRWMGRRSRKIAESLKGSTSELMKDVGGNAWRDNVRSI